MFAARFYRITMQDGVMVLEMDPPRLVLAAKLMSVSSEMDSAHLVRRACQAFCFFETHDKHVDTTVGEKIQIALHSQDLVQAITTIASPFAYTFTCHS
jgi:hypothetical protein